MQIYFTFLCCAILLCTAVQFFQKASLRWLRTLAHPLGLWVHRGNRVSSVISSKSNLVHQNFSVAKDRRRGL